MSELKWNWAYFPYLNASNKQKEYALKAGYIKVVSKDEADAVIKELKAQKAQAEYDCAYWKTMSRKCADDNEVMAKQRAEAFKRERHQKYKRCMAVARWCMTEYIQSKCLDFTNNEQWHWRRWHIRWRNLAKKFKEAK